MLTFDKVYDSDYDILTSIMKRAFDDDTRMHTDLTEDGPHGYDDGTLIRKLNNRKNSITEKVLMDGQIIGAYTVIHGEGESLLCPAENSGQKTSEGEYILDMLFLDPEIKSKGIGSQVWKHIEQTYPDAKIWSVETPGYSLRNHHFYTAKCGFAFVREKAYDHGGKSFIFMKQNK